MFDSIFEAIADILYLFIPSRSGTVKPLVIAVIVLILIIGLIIYMKA